MNTQMIVGCLLFGGTILADFFLLSQLLLIGLGLAASLMKLPPRFSAKTVQLKFDKCSQTKVTFQELFASKSPWREIQVQLKIKKSNSLLF